MKNRRHPFGMFLRLSAWAAAFVAAMGHVSTAAAMPVVPNSPATQTGTLAAASSPINRLGEALFNDSSLSNPAGMSCATCHSQSAGFTFPKSSINLTLGTAPGIVSGRFGNRAVPTISYAVYLPKGPPHYVADLTAFAGGLFWDGRATDLQDQATFPFQNPNEMNDVVHNLGSPALVVSKLAVSRNSTLFKEVFGQDIFSKPTAQVFQSLALAIADYEATPEVSPFTSKYDAWLEGKAQLSFHEMNGLMLITGSTTGRPGGPPHKFAQCALCHGIPSKRSDGLDLFTNSCFANIGLPKNPNNPYYKETNSSSDPAGYNAAGAAYVDLGLGATYYPMLGFPPGNIGKGSNGKGDFLAIDGTFKAPTLRNVDKRPSPGFVKAYFHNGAFKDLHSVVHFYNTRNLTTYNEVIDFTKPNPYANLKGKPLWPTPEFPSPVTLQNPNGGPASSSAQVGNLGLTHEEENEIVLFLQALSDGYFQR